MIVDGCPGGKGHGYKKRNKGQGHHENKKGKDLDDIPWILDELECKLSSSDFFRNELFTRIYV